MTARQYHGFINEASVCERDSLTPWPKFVESNPVFREPGGDYTSTWDAIDMTHKTEGKYGYLPVQIKTIKLGAATELGDIFRNSAKNESFRLIVDFYDPSDKKKIAKTYNLIVDASAWRSHFDFPDYEEWKDWIRNKVSNCYDYDEQWKAERLKRKRDWEENNPKSLVTPTFKRDHKKQRRIQCSVSSSNFPNFIESIRAK